MTGSRTSSVTGVSTLDISGPAVAARNSLVTIRGTATPPGTRVVIWFHHHGEPSGLYLPSRTAISDGAGHWSTTFTLSVDFQYYAVAGALHSALVITRVATLTISGPAIAPRNSLVTIHGTATPPGTRVVIWFHHHGEPSGLYLPSRTATADSAGHWSTTFTLNVDFQYYAVAGPLRSAQVQTRAASLTINRGPAGVVLGGTVTISGTAIPGYSTVSIYFHSAKDPTGAFGIHRTVWSSVGGIWSTTYRAEDDQTYYAAANGIVSSRQTTRVTQPDRPVVYRFPVDPPTVTSYAHVHHDYPATDIFAPCGSRMVAVTGGVVQEVSRIDVWNPTTDDPAVRGGLSISLIGDDGVRYYTAHLLDILPGVVPGARVVAGQLLAHVGETGNARGLGCHVHFGISPPCGPGEWSIRRGTFYPWPYLDSWRTGGQLSPVAAMKAWRAAHSAECAAHRLAGT